MCLDALHDHGLSRINNDIARYAYIYRAHGVSFRWVAVLLPDFKHQPRFFKQKTHKEAKFKSPNRLRTKLTPKCCIILH